ncbi:MAG: sulfite exporter TauE/SafE family protein [Hyphomonadaceae bacterium]|nr:sulfite exporter TauE/SafE family protein [Hyphomonadaceae bacterium]
MIELTASVVAAALSSGAVVGLFLAIFGGGGSVLAAPLLIYLVGVRDPHVAIGTSAAAVAANAVFNLMGHWRSGRVRWPCASVFAFSGLAGSLVGSTIAQLIDGRALLFAFALAMAAIALSMLRPNAETGSPDVRIDWLKARRLAPLGLATGFAAGFFGIGGGFLIVPGLMLATGMTLANASASSLVSVAVFGAATSSNYAVSGLVDWRLVVLLLIGGIAGGAVGLKIAHQMAARASLARKLFAALVLCVAFYVGARALVG